ncbi:MAG: cytochrome c oxidase subunit II [Polyangiaceae bacterium]|nr:cytochrome c oxidase subunit II [Polyangiaceae bacterium]
MANLLFHCLSSIQAIPDGPPKLPESPSFLLPPQAATFAGEIDWLFNVILWVCSITTIGVILAMVYFVKKYGAKSRAANEKADKTSEHNTALEITWSVIPLIIVIAFFAWGFKGFVNLRTIPKDSLEVQVTAQKWSWWFEHSGTGDKRLVVPVNTKVRVLIRSVDVLHSLWIPAFRTKMDAVPGRYTDLWFEANQEGEFPIHCAEYCGTSHSDMWSRVVVLSQAKFEAWKKRELEEADNMPPTALGEKLSNQRGCRTCHSIDGSPSVGPTWKGLFGSSQSYSDASTLVIDENHLKESIEEPQAKLRVGFPPSMPTYKGQLTDKQINGLIAYIKSLK